MPLFAFLLVIIQAGAQENFPVNGVVSKYNTVHALINAEIHVDAETSLKRAVLLVKGDKIVEVGSVVDIPENAIIHNLEGAHVYPSFIDIYTEYGQGKIKPFISETFKIEDTAKAIKLLQDRKVLGKVVVSME